MLSAALFQVKVKLCYVKLFLFASKVLLPSYMMNECTTVHKVLVMNGRLLAFR